MIGSLLLALWLGANQLARCRRTYFGRLCRSRRTSAAIRSWRNEASKWRQSLTVDNQKLQFYWLLVNRFPTVTRLWYSRKSWKVSDDFFFLHRIFSGVYVCTEDECTRAVSTGGGYFGWLLQVLLKCAKSWHWQLFWRVVFRTATSQEGSLCLRKAAAFLALNKLASAHLSFRCRCHVRQELSLQRFEILKYSISFWGADGVFVGIWCHCGFKKK